MKYFNTFTLKMIAIVSMLIDHIGYVLFPEVTALRIVGRLSFPIFAYLLTEGFVYTRDVKKYMLRLAAFALLSEIPYDLATAGKLLEFGYQNVFFTLFFGVLMLWLVTNTGNTILQYAIVAIILFVCQFLHTDYSDIGILIILVFYIFREKKIEKLLIAGLLYLLLRGDIQLYAMCAFPLIALHNREQGPKLKMFFYIFYPAHLLLLYVIQQVL